MKLAGTFGRAYWKDHIFVWFCTSQTGKRVLRPKFHVLEFLQNKYKHARERGINRAYNIL